MGQIDAEMIYTDAPMVEYAPVRRGKWENKSICDGDAIEEWQEAKCSVCHKWHTTPYMYYFNDYNYCPWCGSKMGGDGE